METPVIEPVDTEPATPVEEVTEPTQDDAIANLTKLVETLSADVAELKSNKVSPSNEDKRAVLAQMVTNNTIVQANEVKTTSDILAKYKV
jgi:hypothetical protein